ncbi:DUF4245 domain-containing protein [Saccharopolyspora rhizosphaerae]|uniref:DUF4245 domain-containing protein n=1 Tax=Saccharopolyspora rhizosphaerae TaxID=2492662 RepID=A0A426JQV7_9PSEU|nr:DUF4245 domain-containing protein [Saccharopolyspora rhizosphaerae]RRO15532.1 DUF4245 domain-containing protein [Saccharopolyspora rhizosphaerae]
MGVVAEPRNQQPAPSRPPRTMSAMLFAILPLVLVSFGVAGLFTQCSFTPTGPTIDSGSVPTVDVRAELEGAAAGVDFPVVEPQLPADWRANSSNSTTLPSHTEVVRVGWLTGGGHYLRLAQSTAAEEELVTGETEVPPQALGTIEAGGRQWVRYQGVRDEQAWVTDKDGVRLLITGNGAAPEFAQLAEAALRAPEVR